MKNFILRVILTALQITGNANGNCIFLRLALLKEYVDGKISDNIIGVKIDVVCPDNNYEQFTVKIKGKYSVLCEQLKDKEGRVISLPDLTGRFYRDNTGSYQLSCSATKVEVVS